MGRYTCSLAWLPGCLLASFVNSISFCRSVEGRLTLWIAGFRLSFYLRQHLSVCLSVFQSIELRRTIWGRLRWLLPTGHCSQRHRSGPEYIYTDAGRTCEPMLQCLMIGNFNMLVVLPTLALNARIARPVAPTAHKVCAVSMSMCL